MPLRATNGSVAIARSYYSQIQTPYTRPYNCHLRNPFVMLLFLPFTREQKEEKVTKKKENPAY
jgi:hypothetical protein